VYKQSRHGAPGKTEPFFSVIIPTLNEAEIIGVCLSNIRSVGPNVEVIVVDGGSRDGTAAVAERLGVRVLRTDPCRGQQCNCGAAIASGKVLVFLHADTVLPPETFDKLADIFNRDEVEIGNFGITFDNEHWFLRLLSFLACLDMGLFRFGDQGIVIRKSLFAALGGFPRWELFEDIALIRKARKRTRIHRFPMSVTTSARRFERNGIIRQQLLNVYLTIQYLLGTPPWRLAQKYYGHRPRLYETSLVIFLRLPRPGEVKTRLAGTLGSKTATEFYRTCAGHLLRETEKLPPSIVNHIYYTPENGEEYVKRWADSRFCFRPQIGKDLGARLKMAFRDQFRSGMKRVIAVATDVPDLSAADIEEAVAALKGADLVIGPSADGGYYLIGMTEFHPSLFDSISWSTEIVYEQTLAAAGKLRLKVHSLRRLDDIDTEGDLRRWESKLQAGKTHT
jgi:rSAM/selenodomain-associated transferase 2/rSAM/selenodomain-associated transferase 1